MQDYQREFLDFAIELGVLKFGEFKLKSGRLSPYFFNSGLFNTGASLARLGRYYAAAIQDAGIEFETLYGPAYKGIPLAAAASIALADQYQRDLPYAFNRKEAKDHGEGGVIVGAPVRGRTLIIDDVITAGTSVRESLDIIQAEGAEATAVVIALDRQEKGQGERSTIQEIEQDYGLRVISIVALNDVIEYLQDQPELGQYSEAIQAYRAQYGSQG